MQRCASETASEVPRNRIPGAVLLENASRSRFARDRCSRRGGRRPAKKVRMKSDDCSIRCVSSRRAPHWFLGQVLLLEHARRDRTGSYHHPMSWRTRADADGRERVVSMRIPSGGLDMDAMSRRRMRRAVLPRMFVVAWGIGSGAMALGFLLAPIRIYLLHESSVRLGVVCASLVVLGLAFALGSLAAVCLRKFSGVQARDVARAWLSLGRCPGCMYPISGIPCGNDGCVTCPECAARWMPPLPGGTGGSA